MGGPWLLSVTVEFRETRRGGVNMFMVRGVSLKSCINAGTIIGSLTCKKISRRFPFLFPSPVLPPFFFFFFFPFFLFGHDIKQGKPFRCNTDIVACAHTLYRWRPSRPSSTALPWLPDTTGFPVNTLFAPYDSRLP